jgi:hypothetical protein
MYRGNHDIETMDHLRCTMYHHRKSTTVLDLPPTSYATRGHIQRAFFATHIQINCLDNVSLNPLEYQFDMENGSIVPSRCHRSLPDAMTTKCNCTKCATRTCPCRDQKLACCIFCKCQTDDSNQCKNPKGIIHTTLNESNL